MNLKIVIILLFSFIGMSIKAQNSSVIYLEKVGNGGTRVFSVETPIKTSEVIWEKGKAKLNPESLASYKVIQALLFQGIENFNNGSPLIEDSNNAYAKSILDLKNRVYLVFCKSVNLENPSMEKNRTVNHYIVEVNMYNLLKQLKLRKARTEDIED